VSRQLVERHGGRLVLVASESGARFQVELPLARGDVANALGSGDAASDTASA
jgi:signal transduction histidine kinase